MLAALLPAVTSVTGGTGAAAARGVAAAGEYTTSQDNLRNGWDRAEPDLTRAEVSGQTPGYTFGQVFRTAVTGQVYAQPLVIGSTVIVATEQDYVYGLNARTGAVRWQTSLGTPYQIPRCTDLTPDIGVTGGMVYVGTRDGAVYGFGDTAAAALAPAAPATLPATRVGSASPGRDVTVTAHSAVTVTGVTASSTAASGGTNQFRVGQVTETALGGTATSG